MAIKSILFQFVVLNMVFMFNTQQGNDDCNQDIHCCKLVLEERDWTFLSTIGPLHWGTPCIIESNYIFSFKNNILVINNIIENPCAVKKKDRIQTKKIYQTQYKLIKGKFDQVYVRIYKSSERLERLITIAEKGGNLLDKDSIDFQFLYHNELTLRYNSKYKAGDTYENKFK